MQVFAKRKFGFDALFTERLEEMNIWLRKLDGDRLKPLLYYRIITNVENAFEHDFNMVLEEFDFYEALTPRMQTILVDYLYDT